MTQEEIKKILPHRDKMLLVDEAELCQDSLDENGQPTRCWWTRRKKRMKTAAAAPTP